MKQAEALDKLRALLPEVRSRFNVKALSIFGSTARDEATDASDIDILVDYEVTPDLFKFIGLCHYLEDTLGVTFLHKYVF